MGMKAQLIYNDWECFWFGTTSSGKKIEVFDFAMKKHFPQEHEQLPPHALDPDFWEYFLDKKEKGVDEVKPGMIPLEGGMFDIEKFDT
jgi:hypothetical protein